MEILLNKKMTADYQASVRFAKNYQGAAHT
jgi:hypothetical protein